MASTENSEEPQTNGFENGLDENERTKLRPADIDADVKEMERRKRVEMIMGSRLFREELERIIELQMKDGNGPAGLLQQISDMMGIHSGKLHAAQYMFRGSNCVTPINDIRGVESMGYEKGEKNLRCKLASVFRLMDLYGWSQGLNNQITARLNQDEEHFLVNPHGMLFNEITASSLVKVDMQGNIVEPGTTNFSIHNRGFLLHSAIHSSRPDVNCVIHIKTPSVLAVSSLKCGLLPLCHESLVIGEVSQHPFVSGIFEPEELEKVIRNLGPTNKVVLLHNHGAVCCGATVEEAFYNVYNTVLACETQIKLMPIGVENLILVSDETRKQVYDAAHRNPDGAVSGSDKKPKQFRVGELEFEALIRMLDNAGFRTGYIYRHPLIKGDLPKPKNDVEVPPAVSSLGYLIEQEELYKQGNWKKYVDGRNRLDRTKWLNSPNVYQKVEILETGTSDPKKITKWVDQNSEEWVTESSPTHSSTPVKIDSALQFVPKGTNPKEFKKLQQQIKENRRADKITSGPQSHILEGVSWEEAKKLQDANITQTGDQVILVGAASKGIIQRNYQHNALVYKTPYAKNPFDSMSDKEIEDYKQLVERKQRGDTEYEESQSESEAVSSSRQDALSHMKSPLMSPHSATSETEEESRDEPRVLRIETKTAPRPIQAEVVLSDAESDSTDARVERSHSARYPKTEKPESVNLMNSFRKSWSLKREKDKNKDVSNTDYSGGGGGIDHDLGNLPQNYLLNGFERGRMDPLHYYIARITNLTQEPTIVNLNTSRTFHSKIKSASDPCNLNKVGKEDFQGRSFIASCRNHDTSLSCNNITSDLKRRLSLRRKLIESAKMKFLNFKNEDGELLSENASTSPMRALISEIRETINEIVSPERSKKTDGHFVEDYTNTFRWIERPKFLPKIKRPDLKNNNSDYIVGYGKKESEPISSVRHLECDSDEVQKFAVVEPFNDFKKFDNLDLECEKLSSVKNKDDFLKRENAERHDVENIFANNVVRNILVELTEAVSNMTDEEVTCTATDDSMLPTYSLTETTETEWYYNKTIVALENSQTVLEIKDVDNKANELPILYIPLIKNTDTGIDTDFTSEKELEDKGDGDIRDNKQFVNRDDTELEKPQGENSALNKSSETDSSLIKSSSGGYTSNDIDTSAAFKTETENSEKNNCKFDRFKEMEEKRMEIGSFELKTFDAEKNIDLVGSKLPDIPESPEFTNVDTEDAPLTSSSKNTSPEIIQDQFRKGESVRKPEVGRGDDGEEGRDDRSKSTPEKKKKKRNKKSSTKITVKKELKKNNSVEPVVKEIKLTIKNSKQCQSEKYEVKIQDETITSEELSSSVGENVDSLGPCDVNDSISCDCEAQKSLEKLQEEVSSTIDKLQTIENYFECEIKKHSTDENKKPATGELTIEYNYKEFEDVTNEGKEEESLLDFEKKIFETKNVFESSKSLVSSTSSALDDALKISKDVELTELTLDSKPCPDPEDLRIPEEFRRIASADPNLNEVEIMMEGQSTNNSVCFQENVSKRKNQKAANEIVFDDPKPESNSEFSGMDYDTNVQTVPEMVCEELLLSYEGPQEVSECTERNNNFKFLITTGTGNEPEVSSEANAKKEFYRYLDLILSRGTSPMKAVTWGKNTVSTTCIREGSDDILNVAKIFSFAVNEIFTVETAGTTKNEVPAVALITNFILGNEESPTDSLAEFEDMENLISTSSSIVAEIIDSIESQLEQAENAINKSIDSKRSKDCVFKVVVKTPTKKEIFINYSHNSSSSFDLSNDFEFCNSYVRTDDINDDFESFSSNNSCFFSIESPSKNSADGSSASIETAANGLSAFCSVDFDVDPMKKTPRSLSIIQEVDEVENSSASDPCPATPIRVDH